MSGTVTTDFLYLRENAAPATPPAGKAVLYTKTDRNPYLKDSLGNEVAVLTDSVGEGDKVLTDDTVDVWSVKDESGNKYVDISTENTLENLILGLKTGLTTMLTKIQAGTRGAFVDSGGVVEIDAVGAVAIESSGSTISIGADDVDQNILIGTDGDRTITVGVADGASILNLRAGSGGLDVQSAGDSAWTMASSSATAWVLDDGTNNYILVATDTPAISFGNTTDNPAYNFLGSGQTTFSGPVDVDNALTGTGSYSYSQTAGAFTYNVSGSNYDLTACSRFQVAAGGGASDAIKLAASAGGGFDFDIGTNGWTVDSAGAMLFTGPDDTSDFFVVQEGTNKYISCDSTDTSENIGLHEDVQCAKDLATVGTLSTRHNVAGGTLLTVGGSAYIQDDASSTISNTLTETAFDKAHTFAAANNLVGGMRLRIHAVGTVIDTADGTDPLTLRLQLYDGSTPRTIMSIVASDTTDDDIWEFDAWVTIRTTGTTSTRTHVTSGGAGLGADGSLNLDRKLSISSADFDESETWVVRVTAQWGVADAQNQVRMDDLTVIVE